MKLDTHGYAIITDSEGLKLKPYLDSVNVPTIGYGSTYYENGRAVKLTDAPITKERAHELFKGIADEFSIQVAQMIRTNLNQNQFNAIVSFAYNVGIKALKYSTLLKKVNINPRDQSISAEFMRWNKAGGKVIAGLTSRRKREADLYFT